MNTQRRNYSGAYGSTPKPTWGRKECIQASMVARSLLSVTVVLALDHPGSPSESVQVGR